MTTITTTTPIAPTNLAVSAIPTISTILTRRRFISLTTRATASIAILPAALAAGCAVNAEGLLNTVIASGEAILKVAEPGAAWAASLANALVALQQAEAGWTAGGIAALVIDALNTIQNILAVIPVTAIYSPLIAILVAGITAVLAVLPVTLTVTSKTGLVSNPYKGKVVLQRPYFWQTHQAAYRSQWNNTATGIGLTAAKI